MSTAVRPKGKRGTRMQIPAPPLDDPDIHPPSICPVCRYLKAAGRARS